MEIDWLIFKPVIGYEELYEIDWLCNVRSLNYGRTGRKQILKPVKDKDGYFLVSLCKDGQPKTFKNHRLGMEAWIPNLENKPCVNHKTHTRTDNNVFTQLNWCTHKENTKDAQEFGSLAKGEKHGKSKFSDATIAKAHELRAQGKKQREIAEELSMTQQHVSNVLRGKYRN